MCAGRDFVQVAVLGGAMGSSSYGIYLVVETRRSQSTETLRLRGSIQYALRDVRASIEPRSSFDQSRLDRSKLNRRSKAPKVLFLCPVYSHSDSRNFIRKISLPGARLQEIQMHDALKKALHSADFSDACVTLSIVMTCHNQFGRK